jgi:hypothetical protein
MAHKKRHHASHQGMYEGHNERRHREMKDAGMLHEDKSEVANLPQSVKYHPWPGAYQGFDSNIDDTISGINRQMDADESQARRHNVPKKW